MRYIRNALNRVAIIGLITAMSAACSSAPTPETGQTPQASAEAGSARVGATGEVVPARWTALSFEQAGEVIELAVKEGDTVKAGDLVARLEPGDLQAKLAQMQAALKAAEAQLALTTAGPRAEDVEAARQAVAAARARAAEAVAQRDRLYSSITQADILQAEGQVAAAQLQVDSLRRQMEKIIDIGGRVLAAGEMLDYQIKSAGFQLAAAQALLADLTDGPDPDQLRIANARVWLATAQAEAAQARLDLLLAGPLPQDVAIAQAQVDQARAGVAAAQAQLDQAAIVAPFAGTISGVFVDAHQFVGPGQPVVQIADLNSLRVETTDLNEIDVARVSVGDGMRVSYEALPGVETLGKVARIAPKADDGVGVNYGVVIELEAVPEALRWGMTAFVESTTEAVSGPVDPARPSDSGLASISATGKVFPEAKSMLSFAMPGELIDLNVDVGSVVRQGEVLARLDTAVLDAEVARAEAALKVAQSSLDRVKTGPRPEQVAEAQSNLEAAGAVSIQTAASRDAVANGPTETEMASAQAAAQQALIDMVQLRTQHDLLRKAYDNGDPRVSQDNLDDAAKALAVANRNLEAAQARLDKLLSGADPDALKAANAASSAAASDYRSLRAQVDRLRAGARAEDVAVYEAGVEQAQAALDRARQARARAELPAPFDGVVSQVFVRQSQYVNAGAPIVWVADLSRLHVETTDLSERDIARVAAGDSVRVSFDALPGVRVEGVVARIAPKSEGGSGVNYTLTIDLATLPAGLRWGMTAFVEIPGG